ncbi:MAG: PTS glucose transporter subunit IIA [Selenomonadaceae bacterium]|nr:PTS glucose transporter subunit IIA [Selenomonadaceae bacterium]
MRDIILNSPVEKGQFFSLKDCGETPFVNGSMGRGAAVKNTSGRIILPFHGRVLKVFRNAISIVSDNGINLFIQIGDKSFYEESVRENQMINAYQILAYFNVSKIVMFTVKNDADFGDITFQLGGQNYTLQPQNVSNTRANNSKEDKPQSVSNTRKNNSKENDNMAGRKFTILGETGSGKTCYLLGMYYEMGMSVAGYTVVATEPDADKNLTLRYDRLKDKSRGKSRFPDPSDQVQKFDFNLQYNYETIHPFQWVDYHGGFLDKRNRDITSEQYNDVAKSIMESEMIFICIDGANLTGSSTHKKIRKVKERCAQHVKDYLIELKDKLKKENKSLPPIGMLVTKYDMCADDTDADEVREIVEEAFEGLFSGNDTFVAIIPVSLGDTLEDDDCQGELDPLNVPLPILMGINFALIDQLKYGKWLIEKQH